MAGITDLGVPQDYVPITPNDTAIVNFRGLYVTGAGNVVVRFNGNTDRTIPVIANQTLIGQIVAVRATGTTATGLFGLL